MSYQDIARHLVSGDGRLVAAAALFVFVWVLKSNAKIRDRFLTTPSRKRAAVALLAAIPAAALALTDSGVSLRDARLRCRCCCSPLRVVFQFSAHR